MGSSFSCCFHKKEPSSASGLHTEALRDIQTEVIPSVVFISFQFISSQVLRPRLSPPRLVVCPPPSPRLLNVCGVEESDFRDSSTLCLWSLDPRWAETEEGTISVEVNFWDFGILKVKIPWIPRSTWKVIKHFLGRQKLIQVRRYFWLAPANPQHQQLTSPAVVTLKSQERSLSLQPPVLSVDFNSLNLQAKWRSWRMKLKMLEREALLPVREYLFMTTRKRRQGFIVPFTKSAYSSSIHISQIMSSKCLNKSISSNTKHMVCWGDQDHPWNI